MTLTLPDAAAALTTRNPPNVDFSQIPISTLENIRNRLNQVHLTLRKLLDSVNIYNKLPNKGRQYMVIQNQLQVLITQFHSLAAQLDSNSELLRDTNVYPLPAFPTSQQEGLLTTLLRKKPLPEVDEWIESALTEKEDKSNDVQTDDLFAQWCMMKIQELKDEFQFYGFHTVQELERMETPEGKEELRKKKEEELQEQELERKISSNGKQAMHPNKVLKFMCSGQL
ncbi:mediator of RNA polymerase II transcription subunit 8 [Scheffersomyces spartinae]|uniref:Mediator of RNA polymerase II transcription subunit 8 n=1 Tax=Scheffersomyces spartinae TaxID=45513 RepID=A0A9P8AH38_9ASCO|nr:mediator of RNA polymerase II transcription subunit 8 [Scheffersomyces spartinae]KAG7192298.1 mediator of RNA polymerase II transcription subunit 8 [Scheffersomyces spartinae]